MGYLDNTSVTVDAVLTKLGRQRLAEGRLNITKFALGDDEINYALYDPGHNLGTAYYGEAIERMPILEAFTSDTQALTNKLVTLPKNTQILPVVTVAQSTVNLKSPGQTILISPQTLNIVGANTAGYTFTLGNSDIVMMALEVAAEVPAGATSAFEMEGGGGSAGSAYATSNPTTALASTQATGNMLSATVTGTTIKLTAYSITQTQTTTLTITGVSTGGTVTVPVTIDRDTSLD